MLRRPAALIAATLLAAGPAHAKPAHPPAVGAKPASQPPASGGGPFDARDPAAMVALLDELEAKAKVTKRDNDAVMLAATSPAGAFNVQFGGCNAQGRACAGMQFEAAAEARTATLGEVNAFNQSSFACRIYQDKAGKPHVVYSALVFAGTPRQDMLIHVAAWRGCLADFGAFLRDPPGYLAAAP